MRGGLERWKRGIESQGIRQALAYAFKGTCDSHLRTVTGVEALVAYSDVDETRAARFTITDGEIQLDALDPTQLRRWVDGHDPFTDEHRGRELMSPQADLILDGTINAPKSYSIAALLHPELAAEFEELQDRLRDRIITTWQRELNARRGAGGRIREALHRIEVVELRHRRSRALDPHVHRHLWLSVKVQGRDGQWSNVDSRVAMRLHTLINAEGELAARTDPAWIDALAQHGYTLNSEGEIEELAHAVKPLSRRSNQIEAHRALLLLEWRDEHLGREPDHAALQRIDRMAWAKKRPNKPGVVDETAWEQLIRDEIEAIDPALLHRTRGVPNSSRSLNDLDLDLLASQAIVDADKRSTGSGGRFSMFDIRAGVIRALAASGIVAAREDMQPILDQVVARASALTWDLLDADTPNPQHIKGFMATATAALKTELAARLEALTCAGVPESAGAICALTHQVDNDAAVSLDLPQIAAAGAIAGTDRLVSVTGPAGSGKTTMLRVARAALSDRGRRMLLVAPTKKAASVAGREVGVAASSLHALLADHGWRWAHNAAGAETWTRLRVGDRDSATGRVFEGAYRFRLQAGDRIVVDEAGMVDLHTATALASVAAETGAGIAMVGDHLQAMPVGHAGAMASLTRRATAVVELTSVHRFRDPDYAALTLRMREPDSKQAALEVADELDARGLIYWVTDAAHAREVMVEAYFRWTREQGRVALVTSTNDEADAINEAIQQRRLDTADIHQNRIAVGRGEQRLLEGDIVQTRLNDRAAGVENRALWTIRRIRHDRLELASVNDSGELRDVSLDYAAAHLHLAYASTVHGIQGETTDASIVGPGVDASGLYVGLTRGRVHNEAVTIARTSSEARDQIADSMLRGMLEVSVEDSVRAAGVELGRAARDQAAESTDLAAAKESHRYSPLANRASLGDELSQWVDATRRALRNTECKQATDAARAHAQADWAVKPIATDGEKMHKLRSLLAAREVELASIETRELEAQKPVAAGTSRERRGRSLSSLDRRAPVPETYRLCSVGERERNGKER